MRIHEIVLHSPIISSKYIVPAKVQNMEERDASTTLPLNQFCYALYIYIKNKKPTYIPSLTKKITIHNTKQCKPKSQMLFLELIVNYIGIYFVWMYLFKLVQIFDLVSTFSWGLIT